MTLCAWSATASAQPESEESEWLASEVRSLGGMFDGDRSAGTLLGLLLLVGFFAVLAVGVRRLRGRMATQGIVPSLLAVVHLLLRLMVVAVALAFVVRVLPPRLSLITILALGGFAVALGWSTRDVLPDLVAGVVLVFERRVRTGTWVSGDGFAGQIEHVGLRASLIRDPQGHAVSVPNRHLVREPVVADPSHERQHEVLITMESDAGAEAIRMALRDAVLASPWVHPATVPVVQQDPNEPSRWRVRGRLLEASFGGRFEGDLRERAEAALEARTVLAHPSSGRVE